MKEGKIKMSGNGGANSSVRPTSGPVEGIELVFGLVGPTGVDLSTVCNALQSELMAVDYIPFVVSLSDLIPRYSKKPFHPLSDYHRIKTLMTMGSELRENTGQADVVGRLGIARIREMRNEYHGDDRTPISRAAYIVRSFKRPEEVQLYRDVYGKAFILISVYSPRQARVKYLTAKFAASPRIKKKAEQRAVELINRDYSEEGAEKFGQNVGGTFPLSDYFVTSGSPREVEKNIRRLVHLIFGDPYISPTRDEQGMFFAQAAAFRSLDLSRQVGAAVISKDGDLLSTGCNEVPKFGGGLYWGEDNPCARDFEIGHDFNVTIKREIVQDIFARLRDAKWLSQEAAEKSDDELTELSLDGNDELIRGSKLFDVIEFGRAVHAEMSAITQAAKNGISLAGNRLFCTTFPCHICARHILSSGLMECVFIEPYEKSRTGELYDDSISIEPAEEPRNKASFRAFVGVAPRRYMELFEMTTKRKNKKGKVLDSMEIAKNPKIKRFVLTYISFEDIIILETASPNGR
ncbi:anti-phage dCTP deaminase [Paraburkholderia phenazinium]|uniref:anti-phage dCTP deaminase n=1 Tax=Paraburkholderia phenazinium TaxID=60549 RepID=UPI0015883B7B|nr:anti-phage dCTP deaminase [Paraburkholderia phenazinium]